jgi:hypothetical protein
MPDSVLPVSHIQITGTTMKQVRNILSSLSLLAAAILGSANSHAGPILFAMVSDMTEDYEYENNTDSYVPQGEFIRDLWSEGYDGGEVHTRYLNEATYSDYDKYSQIFVYDLASNKDETPIQLANYDAIAKWYRDRNAARQNLILDGRIISSSAMYAGYLGLGDSGGEPEFISNYRVQLANRGGGLVLGTDHWNFAFGINKINQGIGVGDFTGKYYPCDGYGPDRDCSGHLEAYVDPFSPLYVPELEACTFNPDQQCINDNSSTGYVPTGLQSNGQFLNTVAFHGGESGGAAVSTTMGGFTTLTSCIGADQQSCVNTVSEPLPLALLVLGLAGMQLRRRFSLARTKCPVA